jgi:NADPH:quinone reductase-like Zn-dependent oxidoreductase
MVSLSHKAAFVLQKAGPFVVQSRDTPEPSDDELLVKVVAAGGTEVFNYLSIYQ